jgi:hypothetical protein
VSPERAVALEVAWWDWHDADSARWSPELGDAEERCQAWVRGESDDGPPPSADQLEDEAACVAEMRAEHDADLRRTLGDD